MKVETRIKHSANAEEQNYFARSKQGEQATQTMTISPVGRGLRALKSLLTTLALLLFAAMASDVARAQSCQAILQGHIDWLNDEPSGTDRYLSFVLTSNALRKSAFSPNQQQVATYAEGELRPFSLFGGSSSLLGEGEQYFSNRRWNFPPDPGDFYFPKYPFDPKDTDKLILGIATNGTATLTRPGTSWTDTIALQCDKGVMYGFGKLPVLYSTGAPMYVITVKRGETVFPE